MVPIQTSCGTGQSNPFPWLGLLSPIFPLFVHNAIFYSKVCSSRNWLVCKSDQNLVQLNITQTTNFVSSPRFDQNYTFTFTRARQDKGLICCCHSTKISVAKSKLRDVQERGDGGSYFISSDSFFFTTKELLGEDLWDAWVDSQFMERFTFTPSVFTPSSVQTTDCGTKCTAEDTKSPNKIPVVAASASFSSGWWGFYL